MFWKASLQATSSTSCWDSGSRCGWSARSGGSNRSGGSSRSGRTSRSSEDSSSADALSSPESGSSPWISRSSCLRHLMSSSRVVLASAPFGPVFLHATFRQLEESVPLRRASAGTAFRVVITSCLPLRIAVNLIVS